MKNTILTIATALTLAACGQAPISDMASAPIDEQKKKGATRIVLPLEVAVTSVRTESAEPPAHGLWTDITISANLPCSHELVSFTFDHGWEDGNVMIYASAFASVKQVPGESACQAFSQIDRKFTVPGIVAADQVKKMNLQGNEREVGTEITAIGPLTRLKILDTRPLCPNEMVCVMDGTIVTMQAEGFGCFDELGNIAHHGSQSTAELDQGIAKLSVNALGFHDRRSLAALCQALPVYTFEVTLPLVFVDKDGIDLNILK